MSDIFQIILTWLHIFRSFVNESFCWSLLPDESIVVMCKHFLWPFPPNPKKTIPARRCSLNVLITVLHWISVRVWKMTLISRWKLLLRCHHLKKYYILKKKVLDAEVNNEVVLRSQKWSVTGVKFMGALGLGHLINVIVIVKRSLYHIVTYQQSRVMRESIESFNRGFIWKGGGGGRSLVKFPLI